MFDSMQIFTAEALQKSIYHGFIIFIKTSLSSNFQQIS
jgi:hypothetical protein